MLSDFQIKKISHHFRITDTDGDGLLTRSDFFNHGVAYADSIQGDRFLCVKKEIEWWDKMHECLGINNEEKITMDQHRAAFDIVMSTSVFLSVFLWDYLELIWSFYGLNKYDCISYKTCIAIMCFDADSDDAKNIFQMLDTENKRSLTINELYTYWFNFFYSNNINCPSKWIFGKFNLD